MARQIPNQGARQVLRATVLVVAASGLLTLRVFAQEGAIRGVHDPCLIAADETYYLFSTGPGIPIRRSRDLYHWELSGRVFASNPSWFKEAVPGSSWVWAPDVTRFGGRYLLYYSVSTFGSNRSCIGLATNTTLDPSHPDYKWLDQGAVICSDRYDDWNAIDPNFVVDGGDQPWLAFGSFWSGIKLAQLDPRTGKLMAGRRNLIPLASRPLSHAVEAPFLVHHGDYFFLFLSFDRCCQGVDSTYKVMVGRSLSVTGPYIDRRGASLLEGGGTQVLSTQGRVRGPGHNAVLRDGKRTWFVHHFYDADFHGARTLQIRPLHWDDDGWPRVGEPITGPPPPSP
jgi:arabinan endo-1,5-alpha-L-arabinosidase